MQIRTSIENEKYLFFYKVIILLLPTASNGNIYQPFRKASYLSIHRTPPTSNQHTGFANPQFIFTGPEGETPLSFGKAPLAGTTTSGAPLGSQGCPRGTYSGYQDTTHSLEQDVLVQFCILFPFKLCLSLIVLGFSWEWLHSHMQSKQTAHFTKMQVPGKKPLPLAITEIMYLHTTGCYLSKIFLS